MLLYVVYFISLKQLWMKATTKIQFLLLLHIVISKSQFYSTRKNSQTNNISENFPVNARNSTEVCRFVAVRSSQHARVAEAHR